MPQLIGLGRAYAYDPLDIAVAFKRVAESRYGPDAFWGPRQLFRRRPVNFISVLTGYQERTDGVTGLVAIKNLSGVFQITGAEGEPTIYVSRVLEKDKAEIESFLEDIESHLREKSIYRGKAILIGKSRQPEFLNLRGVSSDGIVYNRLVWMDFEAHLWVMIESHDLCAKIMAPIQHKVLLAGPYGSGKTLAVILTAKRAIERGWTFISIAPAPGKRMSFLEYGFDLARLYQPAIVAIEDIDHEAQHEDSYLFQEILAAIDGMASKDLRVVTVMTTTRLDEVGAAMQRPGRIDKIIYLDKFEAADVKALLCFTIKPEFLDANISWDKVAEHCQGFPPAFVRDVGESAKLIAVSEARKNNREPFVTEEYLIRVADDLHSQFKICKQKVGFGQH